MEGAAMLSFGLVLLFSAVAGMLCVRLRLPPVAGLLVAGMLIGPNVLGLVDPSMINIFSELGAVLLLFGIGVEFSVAKLLSTGMRAIVSSFLLVLLSFVIMHEVALLLGLDGTTSLYVAAMFSMSSTAIMMKILEQKGLLGRQEVPVLVVMLIIEDLAAVFMLTFFSNLRAGAYAGGSMVTSFLLALGVLAIGYFAIQKILRGVLDALLRYQAEDTLVLFAFALGIGMSVLASMLGLAPAIGAFLAGSILAAMPNGKEFERSIRPFSLLFSAFFFLSIGMLTDPSALLSSAGLTLALIAAFMAIVFLSTTLIFFLISSSGRSSVFAGLAMIPLGEFSLLIAKEGAGVVQADLVGIASLGVLLSSVVCAISLDRSEGAYHWVKRHMPQLFRHTLTDASCYFRNVVKAFEPDGYFHRLVRAEAGKAAEDIVYLTAAALIFLLARPQLHFTVFAFGFPVWADFLAFACMALVSLLPIARLCVSTRRLFDALATIFTRTTPQASRVSIMRNLLVSSLFFGLFANTPVLTRALMLPRAFDWAAVLFALLSLFFLWSAIRVASFGFFLSEGRTVNIMRNRIVASDGDVVVAAGRRTARTKGNGKRRKARADEAEGQGADQFI